MSYLSRSRKEQFMSHVVKEPMSGCWLWTAGATDGYGKTTINGRPIGAHRLSYLLFKGPIPDGLFVCHTCDIRLCVNPDHLWLGTNGDNIRDSQKKGGHFIPSPPHGETHHSAKLTIEQVREIRMVYQTGLCSHAALGRQYGISASQVGRIVNSSNWKEGKP